MKSFEEFVTRLLDNPSEKTTLKIKGRIRKINGMARFSTVNFPDDHYIKIAFDDNSSMCVLLGAYEIYYSEKSLGKAEGIDDEMIGLDQLEINGKRYKRENMDDYQFVLQLYVGKPGDIEGECRFSDYSPVSGEKEMLSLGWLTYNGERADYLQKLIKLEEIEIAA